MHYLKSEANHHNQHFDMNLQKWPLSQGSRGEDSGAA